MSTVGKIIQFSVASRNINSKSGNDCLAFPLGVTVNLKIILTSTVKPIGTESLTTSAYHDS